MNLRVRSKERSRMGVFDVERCWIQSTLQVAGCICGRSLGLAMTVEIALGDRDIAG